MYSAEASESDSLIRCGMYEERGMDVSTARSFSIIKGIVPSWIGDLMPLLPRRQETTVRWLPQVAQGHQVLMILRENLYYSVDMRDDVPVGFNPGNGLAISKLCYV
ncbi:hypothetical protein Lal_00010856 [Lupinus albus]|nr:hypothetical protein Lal_00010856 [Lupinus albus]